ncbi:hypothetical protein ANANG_G00253570 [Anguilla anguilla]|uniref:Uncharacterized protein n=1 Tax=Anguilla anguilla TaxID=7936 RepID=A0A9D3LWW8_ANGAN|nr:hypothetical protein ANANG_G00253570 [Anguilla anguilla]
MAGSTDLRCCPRCSSRRESGAHSFGVRSYLHLFYEDCAFATPRDVEEDPRNKGDPVSSWSWYPLLWKASLTAGLLLVVTGGVALSAGLLLPPRIEGFGEGELLMVDVRAAGHNGMLRACRLAGALLLAAGGAACWRARWPRTSAGPASGAGGTRPSAAEGLVARRRVAHPAAAARQPGARGRRAAQTGRSEHAPGRRPAPVRSSPRSPSPSGRTRVAFRNMGFRIF